MTDAREASKSFASPPQSDTEVSDDEAEYFYPSDRRGLMSMPSPVRTSGRRLSFPLQKSDLINDDDDDDEGEENDESENPKLDRSPLHQNQQDISHNITTPNNATRKVLRSNSMGSPRSPSSRRAMRRIKASSQPSDSEPSVLQDKLSMPPMPHKSSAVGEDEAENNKKPSSRRRSKTLGDDELNNQKPPVRRRSTAAPNGPPARRKSTVGEDDGAKNANPSIPMVNMRRAKTMGAEPGREDAPRRHKSTMMDATFSGQPQPPETVGRRRSSMPKNSKPNANANELFYVDPFATTSKEKQVEQGKKIERERMTRRNSLPSAADFNPNKDQGILTPPPPRMRQSKSAELLIPFAGDDDDPYDEEGNLIRRKAPRRRSVTNTPQRFHAVDATTPDFQKARKLQVAKNMKEAMQIDPFANTPDFKKVNKVNVEKNSKRAMQIDPFYGAESAMKNSTDLKSKPFLGSKLKKACSSDNVTKLLSSRKKKGQKQRRASLATLSGHVKKSEDKGERKDRKNASFTKSKTAVDTRSTASSTAGSTDPSSNEFKLAKPRIEQLKQPDQANEGFRLGRRLSSNSSLPKEPRRRSKNSRRSIREDGTPGTPTQKKTLLQRLSSSPKRGKKRFSGLNASNHSGDSSEDDRKLLSVSPMRTSDSSKNRDRRAGGRKSIDGAKLEKGSARRKKEPPTRSNSDVGPRAIRISMAGNIDFFSNDTDSSEPGSLRKHRCISADDVRLVNDPSESDDLPCDNESSKSMSTKPLSRGTKKAKKPESRRSGNRRSRRASVGTADEAGLILETEQSPLPAVENKLPAKRTSKSKSTKKMGRRNSVF